MKVLDISDCMDACDRAFTEMISGTTTLPLRINITPPDGLAIQDVATAKLVYDKAVQAGIGTEIEL